MRNVYSLFLILMAAFSSIQAQHVTVVGRSATTGESITLDVIAVSTDTSLAPVIFTNSQFSLNNLQFLGIDNYPVQVSPDESYTAKVYNLSGSKYEHDVVLKSKDKLQWLADGRFVVVVPNSDLDKSEPVVHNDIYPKQIITIKAQGSNFYPAKLEILTPTSDTTVHVDVLEKNWWHKIRSFEVTVTVPKVISNFQGYYSQSGGADIRNKVDTIGPHSQTLSITDTSAYYSTSFWEYSDTFAKYNLPAPAPKGTRLSVYVNITDGSIDSIAATFLDSYTGYDKTEEMNTYLKNIRFTESAVDNKLILNRTDKEALNMLKSIYHRSVRRLKFGHRDGTETTIYKDFIPTESGIAVQLMFGFTR